MYTLRLGFRYGVKGTASKKMKQLYGKRAHVETQGIKGRFEEIVELTPTNLALVKNQEGFWDISVSYTLKEILVAVLGLNKQLAYVPYLEVAHWENASTPPEGELVEVKVDLLTGKSTARVIREEVTGAKSSKAEEILASSYAKEPIGKPAKLPTIEDFLELGKALDEMFNKMVEVGFTKEDFAPLATLLAPLVRAVYAELKRTAPPLPNHAGFTHSFPATPFSHGSMTPPQPSTLERLLG